MAKINKLTGKKGTTWQIDYIDPNGKRIRQVFAKRKIAEAELSKRLSLIAEGRYLDVKPEYTKTFGELIDKYKSSFEDQASFKSLKKYVLTRMEQFFGKETLLKDIGLSEIEDYRNFLKKELTRGGTVRRPASTNRETATLNHMLNKAVDWKFIAENPYKAGEIRLKEDNVRTRYLKEDEITRLLGTCAPYLKNIVVCALNTGMRRGEILSLKWEDVGEQYLIVKKAKNGFSRTIPINEDMRELFDRIKRKGEESNVVSFADKKPVSIVPEYDKNKRVFTYQGKPIKNISTAFNSALERAGIENCKFHDLRHTFASHLVMSGVPLAVVSSILGHKSLRMTMRYTHLSDESKLNAVSLLNGLSAGKNLEERVSMQTAKREEAKATVKTGF